MESNFLPREALWRLHGGYSSSVVQYESNIVVVRVGIIYIPMKFTTQKKRNCFSYARINIADLRRNILKPSLEIRPNLKMMLTVWLPGYPAAFSFSDHLRSCQDPLYDWLFAYSYSHGTKNNLLPYKLWTTG